MPIPRAPSVNLADADRLVLQRLSHAASTPQALALRCRLVLRAAQDDCPTNGRVADELGCDRHTVATWRRPHPRPRLSRLAGPATPGASPGLFPPSNAPPSSLWRPNCPPPLTARPRAGASTTWPAAYC